MIKYIICLSEETEFGYAYIMTGLCCDDYEIILSEDGKGTSAKCTAKTVKPECSDCGIADPKKLSKQTAI